MNNIQDIHPKIDQLIDNWCDRRALKPLRFILGRYPIYNGLTDEWATLLDALKDIKGLCRDDLAGDERKTLVELINTIEDMLSNR
jgi:hypothetical protein